MQLIDYWKRVDQGIIELYQHFSQWSGDRVGLQWARRSIVIYWCVGMMICVLKVWSSAADRQVFRLVVNTVVVSGISIGLYGVYRVIREQYYNERARAIRVAQIWHKLRLIVVGISLLGMIYYLFFFLHHHFGSILYVVEYFCVMSFFYFLACMSLQNTEQICGDEAKEA